MFKSVKTQQENCCCDAVTRLPRTSLHAHDGAYGAGARRASLSARAQQQPVALLPSPALPHVARRASRGSAERACAESPFSPPYTRPRPFNLVWREPLRGLHTRVRNSASWRSRDA